MYLTSHLKCVFRVENTDTHFYTTTYFFPSSSSSCHRRAPSRPVLTMTTQNSPPESEPATEDANRPRQQNQQNQQNTNNINTPNPGTGQVLGDRHTEDGVKEKEKPSTSDSDGHLSETESEHDLEDEQEVIAAQPQLSRQTSSFVRTDSVVPRSQRRGLLAKFAIIPEIERPYEYKNKTKWAITVLVSIQAAGAPFGTGIFYRAFAPCVFHSF